MNTGRKAISMAMVVLQAGWLVAATVPGSIRRDSLTESENLDWLSVGLGFESVTREIDIDTGGSVRRDIFEAYAGNILFGFDVHPAVTLFVTAGGASVLDSRTDDAADPRFAWSAGLAAHLWKYDLQDPEWMSGTLSIKALLEYASYESDGAAGDSLVEWTVVRAFLPIGFEMFEDLTPLENPNLRMSLNLFAGPTVSLLDGTLGEGGRSEDFDGVREVGVMAGLDLFFAENVSLGGYVEVLDDVSFGGSLRYHF